MEVLLEQKIFQQKELVLDETFLHVELFRLGLDLFLYLTSQQLLNVSLERRPSEAAVVICFFFFYLGRLENHPKLLDRR